MGMHVALVECGSYLELFFPFTFPSVFKLRVVFLSASHHLVMIKKLEQVREDGIVRMIAVLGPEKRSIVSTL